MPDDRHLVVTVFDDQARATAAVEWLKKWDRMNKDVDDIRFGAMAVLTADNLIAHVKTEVPDACGRGGNQADRPLATPS